MSGERFGPIRSTRLHALGRALAAVALLLSTWAIGCTSPASVEVHPAAASIDDIAALWLDVAPLPGISVAVIDRGDTVTIRGYGAAGADGHLEVTDSTVFPIASVTKLIVAVATLQLVEEGHLRLDNTVGDLLPYYAGPGRGATVSHLLSHTSGIPTYPTIDAPVGGMIALFAELPADFEPGSAWAYSNSGYLLLGSILERVTGVAWEEHLEQALFRPLGMTRTSLCPHSEPVLARFVHGGRELRPREPTNLDNHGAAGALCSTPRDLVRFARAIEEAPLLGSAMMEHMRTRAAAPAVHRAHPWYALPGETTQRYGYGSYLGPPGGETVIGHHGGVPGFVASLIHRPAADLTIAVVANGPVDVSAIERQIAAAILRDRIW
jgi:D-alanyl-D-alanine carboxypeptidase